MLNYTQLFNQVFAPYKKGNSKIWQKRKIIFTRMTSNSDSDIGFVVAKDQGHNMKEVSVLSNLLYFHIFVLNLKLCWLYI